MTPLPNVRIAIGKRRTSHDNYGRPTYAVVYEGFPARLSLSNRVSSSANGEYREVDGELIVDARWDLRPGDLVVVANDRQDKYAIVSVSESTDVTGRVLFRSFQVQRSAP